MASLRNTVAVSLFSELHPAPSLNKSSRAMRPTQRFQNCIGGQSYNDDLVGMTLRCESRELVLENVPSVVLKQIVGLGLRRWVCGIEITRH